MPLLKLFHIYMVLAYCAAARAGDGGPWFEPFGVLPGDIVSFTKAISGDGRVVAGLSEGSQGFRPVRWTREAGLELLDPNPFRSISPRDLSYDASVMVGNGRNATNRIEGFRWTAEGGVQGVGDLPGGRRESEAVGVSADGCVVVGGASSEASSPYLEAYRWTPEQGMVGLGDFPGGVFSGGASDVNFDGSIVVGTSQSAQGGEGYRWTAETGMVGLGHLPGGESWSSASCISANGSVIVGASLAGTNDPNNNIIYAAYRWTAAEGMVRLEDPNGPWFQVQPRDCSANGAVIVGTANGATRPFIWDRAHGVRDLELVLRDELGLDLGGWALYQVTGVSADGRTVLGLGISPETGVTQGWVAYLGPPPCPADLDGDGAVGLEDLEIVLRYYGAADPFPFQGDFDADRDIDVQDLATLLTSFGQPCDE